MLYFYQSEGFGASAEGLFGSVHPASVHPAADVVWHCIPVWLFTMGETEHLERRSSRALIFLVLRSRVAFMSKFSCLIPLKSLFRPVTIDFRLFDCSTLNWSNSTRTPALHSV